MARLVSALNSVDTAFGTIRFFAPPHDEPDFAWAALDDVMRMLSMPAGLRAEMLRSIQESWKDDLRTVATAEGIVSLAPHWMLQGLFDAWLQEGFSSEEVHDAYLSAGARSNKVLTMGMARGDRMAYMLAAFARGRD